MRFDNSVTWDEPQASVSIVNKLPADLQQTFLPAMQAERNGDTGVHLVVVGGGWWVAALLLLHRTALAHSCARTRPPWAD